MLATDFLTVVSVYSALIGLRAEVGSERLIDARVGKVDVSLGSVGIGPLEVSSYRLQADGEKRTEG